MKFIATLKADVVNEFLIEADSQEEAKKIAEEITIENMLGEDMEYPEGVKARNGSDCINVDSVREAKDSKLE